MPLKSESQRRLFHAKERRGELPKGTTARWESHTPKKRLPERVGEKKAADLLTRLAGEGVAGAAILLELRKLAGNPARNEGYGGMVGSVGNAGQGLLSVNNLAKPKNNQPMVPGLAQPMMPPPMTSPIKAVPMGQSPASPLGPQAVPASGITSPLPPKMGGITLRRSVFTGFLT